MHDMFATKKIICMMLNVAIGKTLILIYTNAKLLILTT